MWEEDQVWEVRWYMFNHARLAVLLGHHCGAVQ